MLTLRTTETFSQDIKKSRFIAVYGPVSDEQNAKDFIATHSDPAANHNCWAWRVGQLYRFNDDGEPSGTAGKPILQAIDGQGLDHVAVVVIRWFGGILLGSGGLIRAYGGTAAMGLRAAEKAEVIEMDGATITCDFSDLALVKARLASNGVTIATESFTGTGAVLDVQMAKPLREAIRTLVRDLTRGQAGIRFDDE
ncbi:MULTISPECIES: YigZ family protein [unclassified Rhizobium]|uniref:IMPACT family protein n=1 Tax=unclassified Rhizobium TaxID=2613769 RepID=UPI0006F4BE81|nr:MULTISPECIES: YigZ family protein [unclassified Rhizobium]KQV44158.1 hypothetical protein ASC86_05115 [Rhizobium sp. Root1212]KRD38339.1 hypothetical protein ASE37_05115 [Rhizobium sp. Root268]